MKPTSKKVQLEIVNARRALMALLKDGPLLTSPETIREAEEMSDADVLALKYELRGFLRQVAYMAELADTKKRPKS